MSDTPVGPLLKTVFQSILEVVIVCVAGYVLARRGVLDKKTQKQLNRLNISLFTPSLLFSKVAFFLSPAKLRELWIIPIFFVITTGVSMIVALVLGWMLGLKKTQRNFAVAAAMFMNSNSLPIALMQSMVITVPGLKWGPDDNFDAMVGRALTYLVLYSTLGMIVRWSYGVRLLSSADPEGPAVAEAPAPTSLIGVEESVFRTSQEDGLRHESPTPSEESDDAKTLEHGHDFDRFADPKTASSPASPALTHLQRPLASTSSAPSMYHEDEDDAPDSPLLPRPPILEPTSTLWQSRVRRTRHRLRRGWHALNGFMTVPLWASLASLVVACIRPLQHALEAHLQPVKGALTAAGNCSIPVTLVVLGAYFYTPPESQEMEGRERERERRALPSYWTRSRSPSRASRVSLMENVRDMFRLRRRDDKARAQKKPEARPGETKTVLVAVLSRMFITPLLLLPLMALSAKFDLQEVFDDPVFVVANVLLIASPPAVTLAQITQAASGDSFERLISRTIFWSYCVVTPPSTIIVVVVGLLLSKL
ncbi:uncharacterized protein FIBRA_06965 [Fibroporia radiculosa]|uniref:Transporter n=1 Tax=Fibroporia radiculosa TaxID=599839 RepID=J4H4C9_9APHY|nr:uncharacterized protein FIBRA_06965 [Fibroporia radiculosa]CCM04774.1 predicted protein [Fibroporia radiculosa]